MDCFRGKVLVVDDDGDLRDRTAALLKASGYLVWAARDGEEALGILDREETIDLLFTDIAMPGIDGYSLAREARRRRPKVRVLYAASPENRTGPENQIAPGLAPGFEGVIGKPYGPVQLRAEVRLAFAGL